MTELLWYDLTNLLVRREGADDRGGEGAAQVGLHTILHHTIQYHPILIIPHHTIPYYTIPYYAILGLRALERVAVHPGGAGLPRLLPREAFGVVVPVVTPSPPTKSFDFGGLDSGKLLILRGGNSHVR